MADAPTTKLTVTSGNLQQAQGPFMGVQSFAQRVIETTITLTPNQKTGQPITFAGTDSNTVTLAGFRTLVRIENSGGVTNHASVTIFGLGPSMMQQLSTLGMIFDLVQKNTITISAGSVNGGLTPVFTGTIAMAYGNYSQQPGASMHFDCQTGLINGIVPVPALSLPGSTDVATVMAGLARLLPSASGDVAAFENNGVTAQLPPSYYPGTVRDQIRAIAHDAHINAEILPGSGTQYILAIWPLGGSRTSLSGQNIPLVSKDTGMILTPSFGPNGFAIIRNLFNPQITFGGVISVQSDVVPQATREWVVQRMSLALDAYVPKGKWEQIMVCYPKGFASPVPPQAS